MDIRDIRRQVKNNCNISDARYWGFYSICGLLLRMRELYRSEEGLAFFDPIAMDKIAPWIEKRDTIWHELDDKDYEDIHLDGYTFSPFDVDGIGAVLSEAGIVYGAGYGRYFKPNFFLARSVETRITESYTVFITGNEYERDIENVPAMLQGRDIFIRKERIKAMVWEQFHELRSNKYKGALEYAFGAFGIARDETPSKSVDEKIDALVDDILEIFVLHEVGEVMEDGETESWFDMLGAFRSTVDELKLRTIKDVLADCSSHGPLQFITSSKHTGLVAFYVVFLTGLHKLIFPEILDAFQNFVETGDWGIIERARSEGHSRALSRRDELLSLWQDRRDREGIKKILDGIK